MPDPGLPRYRFGPFTLEPAERRLLRDGAPVDLTPKALDVLTTLVERHGHLVTKEDLLDAVWPDVVVDENTLSVNVSRLRAALGETAQTQRYIETVPRSGYRFVSTVETAPALEVVEETTLRRRTRSRVLIEETERDRRGPLLAGALAVVAVVAVALGVQAQRSTPQETPVLPAGGGVEGVPAPDPSQRALAEAAYTRGRARWWKRRGPPMMDEFRLAIHYDSTFAPAYVGLAASYAMGYLATREIYPLLDQALALDPELSEAHAVRGFTRMMHEWDWAGAEADFQRALVLDPDDVSALQWMATLRMIQRHPREADSLLLRALAVAPAEARASLHADRAQALYYAGEFEAAVAAFERARALDPGFTMGQGYAAMSLLYLGRVNEAMRHSGALTPLRPGQWTRVEVAAEEGAEALVRALMPFPDPTETLSAPITLARLHAFLGESAPALDYLERSAAAHEFQLPFVNADPVYDRLRDEPRFRAVIEQMGLSPTASR